MSTSSRPLSICTFADEKSTTPKQSGPAQWTQVVALHAKRRIRPAKSGVMLGGYALNGDRCDANVSSRSLIQLDIDTQGVKDKATGRVLEVHRAAPNLADIRSGIEEFEWCAASSHWHEPQAGVIKYRVVILPDRDVLREEYQPLLEALDERLHGALDRDAWQWSQAFYLPSCPPENQGDAFFERNEGVPLPVDEFVRGGLEIISAKQGSRAGSSKPEESSRAGEIGARDLPPSSALKIVNNCPTLAHVASARGAVSERLWRSMLGVVKNTTEGEALCHEWSKGDPRYDQHKTQQKIDRWTRGPTLCETFRKIDDAKCHGCMQRCKSPIQLGHPDDADPLKLAMQEMNLRYFVAKVGGGVFVFDEQDASILTDAMSFAAFGQFNAGRKVNGKSVAAAWLSSSGRRTYSSLVFDPSGDCPEGNYNTWRGLALEPKQGKCGKILSHICDIWCGGDEAQFEYVLKWMALLVQKPWIKPEVALVLRSKEGTGKTIIVHMLLDIFGVHGFTTAQKDQVAGRFNGHLFDKVLVVLEEAFFAGDPAAVAAAKAMVTNSALGYEAKGKDAFSAPNYAHVITLTNNEWAVPAGADARRWMVLDVSEARMGDHAYFTALADEIRNGGKEIFLGCLLSIPLDGWNPRVLPPSNALHTQQLETLRRCDPVAGWWLGTLSEAEFSVKGGAVAWPTEIPASEMQESYEMATKGARNAPSFGVAAKKLRKLLPNGALPKVRRSNNGDRSFHYQLPDLLDARQHFKTITGIDPCAT
jgi:Family of unknown function (DUF5906)